MAQNRNCILIPIPIIIPSFYINTSDAYWEQLLIRRYNGVVLFGPCGATVDDDSCITSLYRVYNMRQAIFETWSEYSPKYLLLPLKLRKFLICNVYLYSVRRLLFWYVERIIYEFWSNRWAWDFENDLARYKTGS